MEKKRSILFAFIFLEGLSFSTINSWAQTETLGTGFNQAAAASDACGTTNVQIYGFSFNSTTFSNPNFTGLINWTTSGTYVATDILNFKLWQTNFSVFNTTNLLSTITVGLGPGSHTFPAFSYIVSPSPVTRFFWITVDISPTAINGNTIIGNVITTAMTTITGTELFGTNTAGGTQTIVCSVLPIELESFSGKKQGDENILEWTTANEVKNDFFTLERSEDAVTFTEVTTIKGAGNSSGEKHYSVIDNTRSSSETTYYRLKQTDYTGKFKYEGGLLAINNVLNEELSIIMDPAETTLRVYNLPANGRYSILDVIGCNRGQGLLNQVNNEIDVSGYSPGIYFILVETGLRQVTKKIVIKK